MEGEMHRTRPGGLNGGEMYGTRAGSTILLLLTLFKHLAFLLQDEIDTVNYP